MGDANIQGYVNSLVVLMQAEPWQLFCSENKGRIGSKLQVKPRHFHGFRVPHGGMAIDNFLTPLFSAKLALRHSSKALLL